MLRGGWAPNPETTDSKKQAPHASNPSSRPVILDPADPTGDVGGGSRWCWHRLANEAAEWLSSSLCFKDGTGGPVPSWKVPVRIPPRQCGLGMAP